MKSGKGFDMHGSMRGRKFVGAAALAVVGLAVVGAASARASVVYDSIPTPLPPNVPSVGYEATSTSQFGDMIQFAPGSRSLTSVYVTMSNWAMESTYEPVGTSAGFNVPLTLTLYNVDSSGAVPTVGSIIASQTIDPTILWRPEASAGCGTAWRASNGSCYNGLAQNVAFNFTGVTVPDQIIYGLSYNTQHYGPNPTGTSGPYNSLNFGLNDISGPSAGSEVTPGTVFWDTSYAPYVTTATPGVFSQNTGWAGYVPAVEFNVPEPASFGLLGFGLLGLVFLRRAGRGAARSRA